ncbi:MAG TPA: hypothetical protein VFA22_03055, partial [Stellaceae bacterium]|nr:hypothetical protein [Stellaceae bacterium]
MKFDDLGTRCRYLLDRPETVESAVLTAASMIPTKFYREWEDNSPPWIAARAALLLGVPFYAGQHNHDRSPISLVREAIERHYGAQCAAAAAQLQDEQRAALLTAEANWRRAETRRRRQAMADHAALPPMTLRRLAGGMDRFRRSWSRDELVMVLDGARIRPTAEAVEALRGELDFLRQQRDRRRAQRRNYRRQPERSGRRLPAGTPAERLAALRRVSIERAARAIMPFGAALGDDVTLEFGAPSYRIVTRQETRRYGRRSPVRFGRVTGAEHRISVPADWRVSVERRGLGLVAGALTLAAAPRPAPEGIEAVDAVVARPGRGYFAIVERRVYARVAGGAWLHVEAA